VVGEQLVISLVLKFWGIDAQLARRKLGKKIHPDHGGQMDGHYGELTRAPGHSTIIQHHTQQVDVFKLDNNVVFTIY
jgi:hypothetical protein